MQSDGKVQEVDLLPRWILFIPPTETCISSLTGLKNTPLGINLTLAAFSFIIREADSEARIEFQPKV